MTLKQIHKSIEETRLFQDKVEDLFENELSECLCDIEIIDLAKKINKIHQSKLNQRETEVREEIRQRIIEMPKSAIFGTKEPPFRDELVEVSRVLELTNEK